jgi:hypothetical protein
MFTGLTQDLGGRDGMRWVLTALLSVYTPCPERHSIPSAALWLSYVPLTRSDVTQDKNCTYNVTMWRFYMHFCLNYRQWTMHLYLKNSSRRQHNVLHIITLRMFVSIIRHANRTFVIFGLSGSDVFVISHEQCGFGEKMYLT